MSEARFSLDEMDSTVLLTLLSEPQECSIHLPTPVVVGTTKPAAMSNSKSINGSARRENMRPKHLIAQLKRQVACLESTRARLRGAHATQASMTEMSTYLGVATGPGIWESIARRQLASKRAVLAENTRLKQLVAQQYAVAQSLDKLLRRYWRKVRQLIVHSL